MYTNITSANIPYNFLNGSKEFSTIIINNINSCILLLNNRMELVSFNKVLTTTFPRTKYANLNYVKYGEAIGCAYQIDEKKECGATTKCKNCEIRMNAVDSFLENKKNTNKEIIRPFYNEKNEKEMKTLKYSTQSVLFKGSKHIILLIENVNQSNN